MRSEFFEGRSRSSIKNRPADMSGRPVRPPPPPAPPHGRAHHMTEATLIDAIGKLVESNAQLAASVFALAQAITEEDEGEPDAEPQRYMDGTPIE